MREQGSGLLVLLSSVVGRMALPFFGPYNAAKFAVEGLAETYRSELSALGIETCVVEPGAYPTNFIDGLMQSSDRSRDASYGDMVDAPRNLVGSFEGVMASSPAQNPQRVADAIVALVDTPAGERRFRTVVDSLGMADAVTPYNEAAEQVTAAIYGAFGMEGMLTVNADAS
jgi:NAD(P)-dependent dehydrogenase (short-subunit alcohol dehydrogenase family)